MTLVAATKEVRANPIALERVLFELRDRTREGRGDIFSGSTKYKKGAREVNAQNLRILWEAYRDAASLMDLLQRVYLAQMAYRLTSLVEIMDRNGRRYGVSVALDPWRTFRPVAMEQMLTYDAESYHKRVHTAETAEKTADFLRQYCETLAQDRHKSVILSIHNPELLARYHASVAPKNRWSMLSVNVDKKYTWSQRERPIYLRKHMTVEPAGMTRESLQERANTYCDSIRLLGETLDTEGVAYDRPALNIILAVMQELTQIINKVTHHLKELNKKIMQEVGDYKGFQYSGKNVLIDEAKTMRYGQGVLVTNAVAPVQTRQIDTLNHLTLRNLIHVGAMNVDTPALALRMVVQPLPMAVQPDYSVLWERGRKAIAKSIDPMVKKLVEVNKKL